MFDFSALIEEYKEYEVAKTANPMTAERNILPNILKHQGKLAHAEGEIIEIREPHKSWKCFLIYIAIKNEKVCCYFDDFRLLGFSMKRSKFFNLHTGQHAIIEGRAERIFGLRRKSFGEKLEEKFESINEFFEQFSKDYGTSQYQARKALEAREKDILNNSSFFQILLNNPLNRNVLSNCSMISPEKI